MGQQWWPTHCSELAQRSPEAKGGERFLVQEMYFEARGHYEDADNVVKRQLEERPDSQMMLKRQVCPTCVGSSSGHEGPIFQLAP